MSDLPAKWIEMPLPKLGEMGEGTGVKGMVMNQVVDVMSLGFYRICTCRGPGCMGLDLRRNM